MDKKYSLKEGYRIVNSPMEITFSEAFLRVKSKRNFSCTNSIKMNVTFIFTGLLVENFWMNSTYMIK